MSHFKPRILKALFIHRIAVILRGYLYLARFKVFDRVIAPPVTEFQLVGLRTTGEAYHLMTEAYAEAVPHDAVARVSCKKRWYCPLCRSCR